MSGIDEDAVWAAIQGFASVGPVRAPDTWTFDAIKAAIEAYEAARWRPIEQAPRDGTEMLVYRPDMDEGFEFELGSFLDEKTFMAFEHMTQINELVRAHALFILPRSLLSRPPAAEEQD